MLLSVVYSWLYNLFTSFIEGKIKDHLRSQVNYKQLPKIITHYY